MRQKSCIVMGSPLLRRKQRLGGFAASSRRTNFPNEVVEMALAHAVSNRVEAAYRRGDLFEKRRRLMAEWSTFCNAPTAASATVSFHHAVTSEPRSAGSVA
jgi:hypothetical protein